MTLEQKLKQRDSNKQCMRKARSNRKVEKPKDEKAKERDHKGTIESKRSRSKERKRKQLYRMDMSIG